MKSVCTGFLSAYTAFERCVVKYVFCGHTILLCRIDTGFVIYRPIFLS